MAEQLDAEPLPRRQPRATRARRARELLRAADIIRGAINPVVLAGNGVVRAGAAPALREFARATGIPVAETFMGKGALDYEDPQRARHRRPPVARLRDGGLRGRRRRARDRLRPRRALAEHWNPKRDKKIICIDTVAAEIDEYYMPEVELDRRHLPRAQPPGRGVPRRAPPRRLARLREVVLGGLRGRRRTTTHSRCSRPARCGSCARRWAATTSSSPTSGCTSCGSGACSRPTSPTPC